MTPNPSPTNADELDKILQEFGNHVWQCAQLHQGWHPSSVKSKLKAWRQTAVEQAVREARESELAYGYKAGLYTQRYYLERLIQIEHLTQEEGKTE